jgi:hypothetical protein
MPSSRRFVNIRPISCVAMIGWRFLSAQVIAVDTPAYIDSDNAAEAADPEGGHKVADFGSYPPSNPTEDHHANKDAEPVHVSFDSNYDQR